MKTAERIMDAHPDSALYILQHLKPEKYKANSDRALYGLLLSQALDKNDKIITPESLIDFSIDYYQKQNDYLHLAGSYYMKGHMYKHAQRYDDAAIFYLKANDCIQDVSDFALSGKIYADLGDICSIQHDYKDAMKKYRTSLDFLNKAGRKNEAYTIILCLGRTNRIQKNYTKAKKYYRYVLNRTKDSFLLGSVYQEMGINYYAAKQLDSAELYLRRSLNYPYKSTNYSIRTYSLADLLFEKAQYDLSFQFATVALKHPANFYTQRECYRILVNVEYLRKDINEMGKYMTQYQSCGDSIRKVESQTKSSVLESLHNATREAKGTKKSMILIVTLLLIILSLSTYVVYNLFQRNKLKREQLNIFKHQLNIKQEFASQALSNKIEEIKALQVEERKNASVEERERLDKELYFISLHLNNWDVFKQEMNHTFNNIINILISINPSITQKEITWSCLHLLDLPHADRMLLLDATSDSLYKLKQRLAHKLNLRSTKDLDLFLKNMMAIKD
ncbi:MAG: hypothetical protein PHT07_02390 [Paludibacter sp.]|nr:hypothetical protein [Paludibacter sp.]